MEGIRRTSSRWFVSSWNNNLHLNYGLMFLMITWWTFTFLRRSSKKKWKIRSPILSEEMRTQRHSEKLYSNTAKRLLNERFGDLFIITTSFLRTLSSGLKSSLVMLILIQNSNIFWSSVKILTICRVGMCWVHQAISACCYLIFLGLLETRGHESYCQCKEEAARNKERLT